ncbi:MAG: large subunit ribosomal protein L21 [Pelagibacterales bacterium]|nr:large subunit ribosomal protein L21 [Pelagibacterales bacterium]
MFLKLDKLSWEAILRLLQKYEIKTMSFAIIQTGGKQYKVTASEILKIERLDDEEGKTVEFKNILFLNHDKDIEIGTPNIQGAKVEATVLKNTKNKTVLVFKKRRRKNSRKKYGHRQPISLIRITKIFSKDGKLIAEAGPQKKLTQELVKAERTKNRQISEAKKVKSEEKLKIKKSLKKIEKNQKKVTSDPKNQDIKKKSLNDKK